jgi:hypothetical protein
VSHDDEALGGFVIHAPHERVCAVIFLDMHDAAHVLDTAFELSRCLAAGATIEIATDLGAATRVRWRWTR